MKCAIYYRIIIKPMSSEVERRDGCKYLFIVFLQSGLPSNHICIDPICTCCCYLRIWPLVTPTLLCSSLHSILCTSGAYASKIYAKSLQCTFWTCCVSYSFNCGPLHQGHHLYHHHPQLQFCERGTSQHKKSLFWSLKSNKEFFHHIKP